VANEVVRGVESLTFELAPDARDELDEIEASSRFLCWNGAGTVVAGLWLGPVRYLRVGCPRCANCFATSGARRGLPPGVRVDVVKARRAIRVDEELVVEHWDGMPEW
jgi:hypothetical protein